jgi:hypothetical protein
MGTSGGATLETLIDMFAKHSVNRSTDKLISRHAYYYDEAFSHLKNEITSLLEIGINRGGSMRAWKDFFVNAEIYGIDCRYSPIRRLEAEGGERTHAVRINVEDKEKLARFAVDKQFDIIIDDGSHNNHHQIIAFETLWPTIKPGGYYVIEDTAVSWNENHIHSSYPILETYLTGLIRPITSAKNDILYMTIRPNMVVFRKHRVNEQTVELDLRNS